LSPNLQKHCLKNLWQQFILKKYQKELESFSFLLPEKYLLLPCFECMKNKI